MTPVITTALLVALAILAVLAVFQFALVAGAPLGHFAWGGADRKLPPTKRVGSAISVLLYLAFAAVLASRAGVLPGGGGFWIIAATWALVVFFGLSVAMNVISRSRAERLAMTPVCVVLTLAAVTIALGA